MSHDDGISNNSNNRKFPEVLQAYSSRRQVLVGGLGAATTSFFTAGNVLGQAAKNTTALTGLMEFTPVPMAGGDGINARVAEEYNFDVILPWGDPITPGSEETIGIGHDGMWYFPLDRNMALACWEIGPGGLESDGYWYSQQITSNAAGNNHGLLVMNHEFGDNPIVIGKDVPDSLADVRTSQYAHGVAVIEVGRRDGQWQQMNLTGFSRRIHVNTPVEFSGPVAGTSLLENAAGNAPAGTVNNCANGYTPWGTYLTCEENFNGYFGSTGGWIPTEAQSRYGFSTGGFGYGWHLFDPRFDLSSSDYRNEGNRFGWIVEIDPMAPWAKPVKRTALGRFKHEGIAITEGKGGRIVGYMGDDEAFDYIYKFVSDENWRTMRSKGLSPLDVGKLYVARFNDDGTGDWLELTIDNPALAARFGSQAEVLTYARLSADILGATPMDRPEWTTVAPNGVVYCTLTNNSARTESNAANPLTPNGDGHIIRWVDSEQHTGLDFHWDIFVVAADTHGTEDSFADPDGLWADPDGRLFIQTDGGQKDGLENQMVVADTYSGEIKRLFEGVSGCEITGLAVTPDRKTMFINVQHPGADTSIPRDATVVLTKKDGGIIGS